MVTRKEESNAGIKRQGDSKIGSKPASAIFENLILGGLVKSLLMTEKVIMSRRVFF